MESREELSNTFNSEVGPQLTNWGVESVKAVEIMDIMDVPNSSVIKNIKDQKSSEIEMNSRVEIAKNRKEAEIAEIEARKEADMKKQNAEKEVGEKTAEKEKAVGIAQEQSAQEVATQAKITKEKQMEVTKVEIVKQAEIDKEQAEIAAEMEKTVKVTNAEALRLEQEKQAEADLITATKNAEGKLVEMTKNAEGITAEGAAKASAENQMQVALVSGAIALAEKIASNPEYMAYLQMIEAIKASQVVGTAKADALKTAEVKILANSGNADGGLNGVMDIFSGKGGTAVGSMLENLANTDLGKDVIAKVLGAKKADTFTPASEVIEDKNSEPSTVANTENKKTEKKSK